MTTKQTKTVTPEQAVTMLAEHNFEINYEEANSVIAFMQLLAEIYLNGGEEL